MRATIINWDGTNLPEELHRLPPGQYVVEVVDDHGGDITELTPEEDAGIRLALDQVEAGQFVPYDVAMRKLRARLHPAT